MRGSAPLWFLAALFLSGTCFVFLLNNKILRKKPLLGHLFIVAITVGGTLIAFNWFESIRYTMSRLYLYPLIAIFRLLPSLLYVEIGYLLGFIWENCLKGSKKIMSFWLIVFVALFVSIKLNIKCGMNMHTFDYTNIYYLLVLGILGSISLILICCLLPENLNILAYIGKKSMEIMILHYPPIPILRIVSIVFVKLHLGLCCSITLITTWLCLIVSDCILQPLKKMITKTKNERL